MVAGHVFIACSLDGFIARSDGDLDWLMKHDGAGDTGYDAFMANIDGLIMGRGTFEKVLPLPEWPYAKPVVVMSRSLTNNDVPAELSSNVSVTTADPHSVMDRLGERGWRRAYVDGGQLIQSFLLAGLIADMTVTVAPVLIGEGRPLFGTLVRDIDLELTSVKQLGKSGMAQLSYKVRPNS